MECQPCVFLGIKVKPGTIERFKVENFPMDRTVDNLKSEAEKKTLLPSSTLELIYHGKVLKDEATLKDSGVKSGEMVHVLKKKVQVTTPPPAQLSDAEIQQLNTSLRTFGCTPNAPGWTRAMQILNDESTMNEIMEHAPSLNEDCVTLSILNEVELLAALGANMQNMRRGAAAHPELPHALRQLTRLVRSRAAGIDYQDTVPTSGFAYSLEALSDDEDAEEEDPEEAERNTITHEHLAAALQAANEAVSTSTRSSGPHQGSLLRLLQAARAGDNRGGDSPAGSTGSGSSTSRAMITPEMFSEAISDAINRAGANTDSPMEQSDAGTPGTLPSTSSESPAARDEGFGTQIAHMHEMGLLDDALNMRALLICAGDVNAAINLVFSGAIGDD